MTEPRDPTPEAFASEPLRTAPINAHPVTGRPLDADERIERREEVDDGLRVERFAFPGAPDLVALRVVDRQGRVRGVTGFEWDVMEADIPERMLARVRRGHQPTKLRLVG